MQRKRKASSRALDRDDAPELTGEWFRNAAFYEGDKLVRPAKRGRPALSHPKQQVTLRLDADIVRKFRATGSGWQTRINEALKRSLAEARPKRSTQDK
ncbi:MAG: BrnA antitoxin family protein [Reyranellaceae bacterium]